MSKTTHEVKLSDYLPPVYLCPELELEFELGEATTQITSRARYQRNPAATADRRLLHLHGVIAELESIHLSGRKLEAGDYELKDDGIEFDPAADDFELVVVTRCQPQNNKTLEGLYRSGSMFCTQCEAEGFRKITFFQDRPDVMTVYRTRIIADAQRYPVLLANGNLEVEEVLPDGRHAATWHDPFKKPSYLFALVAGDLSLTTDQFKTMSGRAVDLRIYVNHGEEKNVAHALDSLKRAMRWDEEVYGREYDLDLFMIVAVHDFNFGAMENKGLNIFNASAVLAHPETASDADFERVEGIVAHEYFHNWSGNRVTLRDWFQLSLKEGFTVFRDQSFSADMHSMDVKRIEDVRQLRSFQFAEDAGPMAHPIRPESFVKIDNFYTTTVYEKGAEVVRMIHRLLGPEKFRAGSDLYFSRHDGEAVTCEDFVLAMEAASGVDLSQFRRWYSQAGTPRLSYSGAFNAAEQTYSLTISQRTLPTPGQAEKQALHIPVALGLMDEQGQDLPLRLPGESGRAATSRVLELREASETFVFSGINCEPTVSLLRGFSAPCLIETPISRSDLLLRLAQDSDGFNRWDAGQTLATDSLLAMVDELVATGKTEAPLDLVEALGRVLADQDLDPALAAETLILPGQSVLGDRMELVRPDEIFSAREVMRHSFASRFRELLLKRRAEVSADEPGARRFRNVILGYLAALDDDTSRKMALDQIATAKNMTDEMTGLAALLDSKSPERDQAFEDFRKKWRNEPLVMNKWFAIQAGSSQPGLVAVLERLWQAEEFDENNPNKVRSLLGAFAMNQLQFHARDGSGYDFVIQKTIELDARNPQLAARMLTLFSKWKRFDAERQLNARRSLESVAAVPTLSANSREVVQRTLDS